MTRARSLSRLANSQAFTVDGDLDVGINSTSPSSKLDVNGDINVTGVVTATSFAGNVTGNADTATTSTYATTAGIATYATTAGIATYATTAGIATNAQNLTGNPSISVTDITATGNISIAGTLTYEDVTNVDSIGIITARSDISIADKIVHTGDTDTAIRFPVADTFTVETAGSERVRVTSIGNFGIGTTSPGGILSIGPSNSQQQILYGDGTGTSFFRSITDVNRSGADQAIHLQDFKWNGNNVARIGAYTGSDTTNKDDGYLTFSTTDGSGIPERMRITSAGNLGINSTAPALKLDVNGGLRFAGEALENVNITAGTLLANQNIDLTNGMVHYFTSNETGISTANIRIDGSTSLDSRMNTGNTAAVTILTTPNNAGYSTCVNIDGSYNVVQWLGGAAPSAGGASGIDAYTYQIIKTGSATFTVLGSVNNFA